MSGGCIFGFAFLSLLLVSSTYFRLSSFSEFGVSVRHRAKAADAGMRSSDLFGKYTPSSCFHDFVSVVLYFFRLLPSLIPFLRFASFPYVVQHVIEEVHVFMTCYNRRRRCYSCRRSVSTCCFHASTVCMPSNRSPLPAQFDILFSHDGVVL